MVRAPFLQPVPASCHLSLDFFERLRNERVSSPNPRTTQLRCSRRLSSGALATTSSTRRSRRGGRPGAAELTAAPVHVLPSRTARRSRPTCSEGDFIRIRIRRWISFSASSSSCRTARASRSSPASGCAGSFSELLLSIHSRRRGCRDAFQRGVDRRAFITNASRAGHRRDVHQAQQQQARRDALLSLEALQFNPSRRPACPPRLSSARPRASPDSHIADH